MIPLAKAAEIMDARLKTLGMDENDRYVAETPEQLGKMFAVMFEGLPMTVDVGELATYCGAVTELVRGSLKLGSSLDQAVGGAAQQVLATGMLAALSNSGRERQPVHGEALDLAIHRAKEGEDLGICMDALDSRTRTVTDRLITHAFDEKTVARAREMLRDAGPGITDDHAHGLAIRGAIGTAWTLGLGAGKELERTLAGDV